MWDLSDWQRFHKCLLISGFVTIFAFSALGCSPSSLIGFFGRSNAETVLQKARQAQGGADVLQRLDGYYRQVRSTAYQGDRTFSMNAESWIRLPDQFRQETTVHIQGQSTKSVTIWNGEQGWVKQQGDIQELNSDQMESIKQSLYFDPIHVLIYTDEGQLQASYQGSRRVNGTETKVIQVMTPQGQSAMFYFDAETYLPIQRTRTSEDQTIRTDFSGYRTIEGYSFPLRQETYVDGDLASEMTVERIDVNPDFNSDLFEEPE